MDIGSAVGRASGVSERQLLELATYRESDAFDDLEKLVIDFAVAISTTPTTVTDELRDELLRHMTRGQLAELATWVAWEHHRARLNRALGIREMGFSDGAVCALPEHRSA
jgi:alkylhydroperoxidase family enzyme